MTPPKRGYQEDLVGILPDSSDDLGDQSDRGKSIKEETGPVMD